MSQLPPMRVVFRAAAVLSITAIGSISQQGFAQDTPKAVYEKYKLIGVFALDCGKPASKDNFYYVNRLLADGRIQGDRMSGPETRDFVSFIDKASERKPGEISISGTDGEKTSSSVWKIEDQRMMVLERTVDGQVAIGGGRWLNRCGN